LSPVLSGCASFLSPSLSPSVDMFLFLLSAHFPARKQTHRPVDLFTRLCSTRCPRVKISFATQIGCFWICVSYCISVSRSTSKCSFQPLFFWSTPGIWFSQQARILDFLRHLVFFFGRESYTPVKDLFLLEFCCPCFSAQCPTWFSPARAFRLLCYAHQEVLVF
jgi:hypothetical protein